MPEGCDREGASNVIPEDRARVRIRLLDGRPGEADVGRIRQRIPHVACEAIGHRPRLLVHLIS